MYHRGVRVAARRNRGAFGRESALRHSWGAPIRGWVINENLADQDPRSALVLDNWFTTERGIKLRGGAPKVATVGAPIKRLFTYYGQSSSDDRFFAASANAIYSIGGFDPDTAPSADVSSLNAGDWSAEPITTPGGSFLFCCNSSSSDAPRYYGTSGWVTPTITGVTPALLRHVWSFKSRLMFVEKDSLTAHYLPVNSLAGAVGQVELGAVFRKGGTLLFGATWSQDAGDGLDDLCVFVTTRGEVAVYQGSDPGDASAWALVGVYEINKPLGPNASMRAGGDLVVATEEGLVPMSQAVNKDPAALSLSAVSRAIEPAWRANAQVASDSQPWEILKWARENKAFISLPHSTNEQYVVNLKTGAWSRYTGWDVQHLGEYQGLAYYADSAGDVFQIESGGQDDGASYVSLCAYAWDDLKSPAQNKQAQQIRATFNRRFEINPRISVARDYNENFPTAPDAITDVVVPATWGSGIWGASKWGVVSGSVADQQSVTTRWRSAASSGFTFSPQIQVTNGNTLRPDAELIRIDMTYELGGSVV